MCDNQPQQLVVQLGMFVNNILLLEWVVNGMVQLAAVAKPRVARDGVVGHVARADDTVTHVAIRRKVALVTINQLAVQVLARAVGRRVTAIEGIIDHDELPRSAHDRARVTDLDEDGRHLLLARAATSTAVSTAAHRARPRG